MDQSSLPSNSCLDITSPRHLGQPEFGDKFVAIDVGLVLHDLIL